MKTDAASNPLKGRIEALENIERLRRLKYHYAWYLDNKMWDDLRNLYTEDGVFVASGEEIAIDQLIEFCSTGQAAQVITTHQLHQSLIDIISDTEARGVWSLRDELQDPETGGLFRGRAHYHEQYRKLDGVWKFQRVEVIYHSTEGASRTQSNDTGLLGLVMPSFSNLGV